MLILSLIMTLAALLAAEELEAETETEIEIERHDFSDPAYDEDKVQVEEVPSQHIEAVSLLPHSVHDRVEIGQNNTLLVALSNLGGKMYNVTFIDGYLQELDSETKLGKFKRTSYGEALGPREQRSFRYLFLPSTSLKAGEYRLIFQTHYEDRGKAKFFDSVFNETIELVPHVHVLFSLNPEKVLIGGGAATGFALLFAIAYMLCGGGAAKEKAAAGAGKTVSGKKATGAAAASATGAGASEWLEGTLAGSEGKKKRAEGKKRA